MTDEYAVLQNRGAQILATVGSGADAHHEPVDFQTVLPNSDPETVSDETLLQAVEEYLMDELERRGMHSFPRNYIVTRGLTRDGERSFIVGPKPEFG